MPSEARVVHRYTARRAHASIEGQEGYKIASVGELDRLARSFERQLYAENKSPKTVETYGGAIQQLRRYVTDQGVVTADSISQENIEDFIAELVAQRAPATANNRFRALQQFFNSLTQ